MYKNKKEVDKHVESLSTKLSAKEFKARSYSIARLYYEVGDYTSCQRYVEQYLTVKNNNAAASKLLGQALLKLGQKEKALEQFKISLDLDSTQTSTVLDICELLVDDEVVTDLGRARYWCEKAEAIFPRHPITFRLREKLVATSNPNPEALVDLLTAELAVRPKDALLHGRLLKHYIHTNQIEEAINHSCAVEFGGSTFRNNFAWYETLLELVKHNSNNYQDWLFQLLLLTVRERMCVLSIAELSSTSKSLVEANEILFLYDQDIEKVDKAGPSSGCAEFHNGLLQHHRGQLVFHAATLLLKKAKKDQISWHDATQFAAPLMLMAWHSFPTDTNASWLFNAPEKQKQAARRWYIESSYKCSQSGHYLISNNQGRNQSFIDRVLQCCSGIHWRDKIYEKIFNTRTQLSKIKSSHFVNSTFFSAPVLRFPRKTEVDAYDVVAQMEYVNSLHHYVWILLNYKNYAQFKCNTFDSLCPRASNCGPESLSKIDIHAFFYCATLTCQQQKSLKQISSDTPIVLPANITDLLCTVSQMKWWDCAYKFSQNELGSELTDIRATLGRGIEVVRCVDNHGLDPELLCILGRIFSEKAKLTTAVEENAKLDQRAILYYSSAEPLLEKLKRKMYIKFPEKRLFDYTHEKLETKELNSLIEESKMFLGVTLINDGEYDKAIEMLSNLKSPEASYHLSQSYMKVALEESNNKEKYATLLSKAKNIAYNALKHSDANKTGSLYVETQELIEELDKLISKIDPNLSSSIVNDVDEKYSSDENGSLLGSENVPLRSSVFRNLSSTPKAPAFVNTTNYRTAIGSQILENTRIDQRQIEKIEAEINVLRKRDNMITDFMEQSKKWFDENRKLGNDIISTINTNIQHTTDQFKLLKISVDQVKEQVDECRNESKDVGELKKQLEEMKKEITKLKKASSDQTLNENELYNLEDEYRSNDNTTTFNPQLPFAPHMLPQFNQRLIPPFPVPANPYQLYGQNLYNLYNQYSQFGQAPQVPGAPPIFDPTRGQINFPGVYPTPESMYLDMAQLVSSAPSVSVAPTVTVAPNLPIVSSIPQMSSKAIPTSISSATISKPIPKVEPKEIPRSLPVNVVITSSDPLPPCTTTPAPVLSVTIPSKHIKNSPHNYQITLPSATESKDVPPVFSFPTFDKNLSGSTAINWNQSSVFKVGSSDVSTLINNLDVSQSVVDGNSSIVSLNKSRTLSEKSNTSVDYDPCPDFKPIIPLPDEVKVTTGEENETVIFSSRAKLYRFVDKQWKERGLGDMKLLKHKMSGKVRVLMRREQIHKICANHIISSEMEINPMQKENNAYIWVANDFADETVVLEKFCVRFKTADIAKQFYEKFEQARKESTIENKNSPVQSQAKKSTSPVKLLETPTKSIETSKPGFSVGGFTFSSTPTFKPVSEETKTNNGPTEPTPSNKLNIFSALNFKTNTSSPFSNIFTTPTTDTTDNKSSQESTSKLNTSDVVEEFEPNVEFTPVIPLPALVDQKTGEENELVSFEHRAKLLRFDSNTKEWKERGLGNIKILTQKDNNQKVRLLMRREQIMKVCCNHSLTKEMVFQKMPNMDKAVTWCCKDFSDGELVSETFCLRFKTVQVCDNFIEVVKTAQAKMKDTTKAAKEEQNAAKQVGFGDAFKPKPGAWSCDTCYTNNLESYVKCACCEQPKSTGTGESTSNSTLLNALSSTSSKPTSDWGAAFKPKPGSWECKECFIRNDATIDVCSACSSPKDGSAVKSTTFSTTSNSTNFKFGMTLQNTTDGQPIKETATSVSSGWVDKFKPKEGSWECHHCLVRNEGNNETCNACSNPKDPNAVSKDPKPFFSSSSSGPKFNFGIPANANDTGEKQNSIFDGTGAQKFSFGIPYTQSPAASIMQTLPTNVIFATPTKTPDKNMGNCFSLKKDEEGNINVTPKPFALNNNINTSLSKKEGGGFDFVFKPKSPTKGKSPVKSPCGEDSDENEYASEDEGHHIHFSPVIPLPDKVDVVTGEENEEELYGHRAKLYKYVSGEWKERGIGIVKILKHKTTGKLRVVMRREKVLKICLNHALTSEITYLPKDDSTWLFAANDFSEGELSLEQFCLRFKNKSIATEFKDAIENAKENKVNVRTESNDAASKKSDNNDVIFIGEIQATAEEKQKANELMLPENFYTYKSKAPCKGCRGCDSDEDKKITNAFSTQITKTMFSTPVKTPAFSSPSNSMYGTPANFDKIADVSSFRTPLGTLGSNTSTASSESTDSNSSSDNDSINKENSFLRKPSSFNVSEQKTLFGTSQNSNSSTAEKQSSMIRKTPILATPKLSTFGLTGDSTQNIANKTQTENAVSKPNNIFSGFSSGMSSNKSIFSFSGGNNTEKPEQHVSSLFGSEDQKPVNLFSGSGQGSLFGPATPTSNQNKNIGSIFASVNSSPSQVFGNGRPVSENNQIWTTGSAVGQNKPDLTNTEKVTKESEEIKSDDDKKNEPLLKIDGDLTFASLLSSSKPEGFTKNTDFQWEGAGQQLFRLTPKSSKNNKSRDEGQDDENQEAGEEEYDPYYEPIVPLPEKITVSTGEEDEEKLFGERGKLYRYIEKTGEWKERGVGEMKILYHPERNSYRLLLRREQVHKAVLNMLLFIDLELLPMKKSMQAWIWAGLNYAESAAGEQETLAVRFKTVELAERFHQKVTECVRKLQAAAAQAIREEPKKLTEQASRSIQFGDSLNLAKHQDKEEQKTSDDINVVAPLRLPKHLQDSARADNAITAKVEEHAAKNVSEAKANGETSKPIEEVQQVRIQEPEEAEEHEYEDEEAYEYDHNEDYDAYYNEYQEEEESAAYYSCVGDVVVTQGSRKTATAHAQVQVVFDPEIYTPKILITDSSTGELLADMVIHTDTEFQLNELSCTWTGTDFTSNNPVDKTVTINFKDIDTAMQFYDSCETSKASTYSSTDHES